MMLATMSFIDITSGSALPQTHTTTLATALSFFYTKIVYRTIGSLHCHDTRRERRSSSNYASLKSCHMEVMEVEGVMRREGIHWLSTTTKSIEKPATSILQLVNGWGIQLHETNFGSKRSANPYRQNEKCCIKAVAGGFQECGSSTCCLEFGQVGSLVVSVR